MTDRPRETGRLEEPRFVPGVDPMNLPKWKIPRRRNPWARHFELGRQHPRQWMLVGEYKTGGCRARMVALQNDRYSIAGYLRRWYPLERWTVRGVTLAGTHCDRELYLRYLTELTQEEHQRDIELRHEAWIARQAKVIERKAREAEAARKKAREDEAAAKVRIRARRRPGQ